MKAPPPAPAAAILSPATPPSVQNVTLLAPGAVHYITAGDSTEEQVRVHTSAFTPQLRALFAESGQGESCLND